MTEQLELPIEVPEIAIEHHAFEPWNCSGQMLGCKRCLRVWWAPCHGLPFTEKKETNGA